MKQYQIVIIVAVILIALLLYFSEKAQAAVSKATTILGGDEFGANADAEIGDTLKIVNPTGLYASDIDPTNGCMTIQLGFVPFGTEKEILEVKKNFDKCIAPLSYTIVRTSDGWFSLGTGIAEVI